MPNLYRVETGMEFDFKPSNSVAVAGVATTDFGKLPQHDTASLGIWAFREAVADAGLTPADIDGVVFHRVEDYQKFLQITNIAPRLVVSATEGGRMFGSSIQVAVQAIMSGAARTVALVYGNDGRSAGARYGGQDDSYGTGSDQFWAPYGMTSPGAVHAMLHQRHKALYGTTEEQLAAISMTFRKHASLNPKAVLQKPITIDDYFAAPFICEPLRRLDYCLINDGGVALILTSGEHARDLKQKPVYVRGMAQRSRFASGELPEDFGYAAMQDVSKRIHEKSGLGRSDVDSLMIYDNFTPIVVFALEGFGYCGRGEGGAFARSGALALGGRYPTNTNGGHLSESYMQGWSLNVEAVRQVRGDLGARQVQDAKVVQYLQGGPMITSIMYCEEDR